MFDRSGMNAICQIRDIDPGLVDPCMFNNSFARHVVHGELYHSIDIFDKKPLRNRVGINLNLDRTKCEVSYAAVSEGTINLSPTRQVPATARAPSVSAYQKS